MKNIANFEDMQEPRYRELVAEMKEEYRVHRKQWEFVAIADRILSHKGTHGIGFGVGTEPLPALFAKHGKTIIATDQLLSTGEELWKRSNQICPNLAALNERGIAEDFSKVSFQNVDMNYVPNLGKFDFLWSSCALEHLGTLQNGLWFIVRTLALLKPGGIAVHTTEYNISSNDRTNTNSLNNIYRKQDLDLLEEVVNSFGFKFEKLDLERSNAKENVFVDGGGWPGWNDGKNGPHINLKVDGFDATSVLLVIHA